MAVSIITSFLTLLGVVLTGTFFLWTSFRKKAKLRAELACKMEEMSSRESREKAARYIALLAWEFSKAEKSEVRNRHFTAARNFYMEYTGLLGLEPKHFEGLFMGAKEYLREMREREME